MRKLLCMIFSVLLTITLFGCGDSNLSSGEIDLDLTKLSSTMVYSEVYNMMNSPDKYVGKTVRMKGSFRVFDGASPEIHYYTCMIADATACCQQGMEFILAGDPAYPDAYPHVDEEITVTGEFETYYEGEQMYCHLKDAKIG